MVTIATFVVATSGTVLANQPPGQKGYEGLTIPRHFQADLLLVREKLDLTRTRQVVRHENAPSAEGAFFHLKPCALVSGKHLSQACLLYLHKG